MNVRANAKDLYEDLEDMDPSVGLTRDNAAQMVFNAIQAVMVEYDYNLTTVNGQLSTVAKATDMDDDDTILVKKFAMNTGYGTLYNFTYDDVKDKWTYDVDLTSGTFVKDYSDKDGADNTYSAKSTSDYTGLWNRSVKVLSKTTSSSTTIYGIFADDSVVVATALWTAFPSPTGTTTSFKIGSTVYKVETNLAATNIYAFHGDLDDPLGDVSDLATAGSNNLKPYDMQVIDDDNDGKVDYIIVVPSP